MKAITLTRIGVLKISLISGVIYAILGLIIAPFILILMAVGGDSMSIFAIFLAIIIIPVFYGILGFVMCAIAVGLFNFVALRFGGVESALEALGSGIADDLMSGCVS